MQTTKTVIILVMTVISVMGVGLAIVINNAMGIIHDLSETLSDESNQQFTNQAEYHLSLLAHNKANLVDKKLSSVMGYVSMASQVATTIKSAPEGFLKRHIHFPDPANEGVIVSQLRLPADVTEADTLDELMLMANIEDILIPIYTHSDIARTVYLGSETGISISVDRDSHMKTHVFEPRTRPWYILAVEQDDIVWSPVFVDLTRGMYAISCTKPYHDENGNIAGVVGMNIMLDNLGAVLISTEIGETGHVLMVNEYADVLFSGRPRRDINGSIVWENLFATEFYPPEIAERIIERTSGIERLSIGGVERIIIHEHLQALPWSVVIIMDVDEVIAPASFIESYIQSKSYSAGSTAMRLTVILVIIAGALLLVVGVIIVYKLTEAFNQMISNAGEITAEKIQATEASQHKSRFLANMSHEIRTPMNAVMGITEILRRNKEIPPDAQDELDKMFISCEMLLHIINDILDLSKIEEGKMEINPGPYDTANMIHDSVQLNMLRIEGKDIRFELDVDANIPSKLIGDELRIKQILNNLLSNAFKYTDSGKVTFTVFTERDSITGDTALILCIKDTGHGMTREQLGMLFTMYTRFHEDAVIKGTGLGLSITNHLIGLMNGMMDVDSEVGEGTSFIVRLPQGTVPDTAVIGEDVAHKLRTFQFRQTTSLYRERRSTPRTIMPNGHILLVDDSSMNLHVTSMLLKPYELKVDTAISGYEAIEYVKSGNAYDIIFMDQMMPIMNGTEAAKRIRELGYRGKIIAFTANAIAGQDKLLLAEGFDGFLSKPIDLRLLDIMLNKFINEKEPGRELPGVNITAGLALYDNSMEMLEYAFQSYLQNVPDVVEKMRGLTPETLSDYATLIHAIKGNSACIGAEVLAKQAQIIEDMAKNGDYNGVYEKNAPFINDALELLNNVELWLLKRANG